MEFELVSTIWQYKFFCSKFQFCVALSKLTSLKISVLICKKVMMVRLPRIQMRKHIKCLAERQIAGNTTYYHHFKCIHKGEKTKLHTFFIPRPLLTNTCNIYRNKCTAISANIYCCIFLSSSSFQSFCYEESLPIGGDCLPRIGYTLFPLNPGGKHMTQSQKNFHTLRTTVIGRRWACDPSFTNQGLLCHSNKDFCWSEQVDKVSLALPTVLSVY